MNRKNFTKGYTDLEIKVRDVTSNDPRNPSGRFMQEIAAATHQPYPS
jgi:epsin